MNGPGAPRILLIRLSSLGDVVLATSAAEALKEDVPEVEVHVLTRPAFREVFEGNPAVAEVLVWEPGMGVGDVARSLRRRGYRWIADLHGNLRTRLLRASTPGLRWVSYAKGSVRRRLAVALGRPSLLPRDHVVDRYLRALGPLGVSPRRRMPRVCPPAAAREKVERLLREARRDPSTPFVALAPGARWATKEWPKEHWVALLSAVERERLAFPVLLGGRENEEFCGRLLTEANAEGLNLAGKTAILETAAALGLATALVTNDSAPLHLAGAVGTPVVALFGPTVRGFGFYPLGPGDVVLERELACRPCGLHGDDACPQKHHRCLEEIRPAEVLEALRTSLERSGALR